MNSTDKLTSTEKVCERAAEGADHWPAYPIESVQWLIGNQPARVLELGAGTGKLTATLCALGHDVVATDPSADMLVRLASTAPAARTALARAEDIPLAPASADVVVAAQAFHWFDRERALTEIARVLRPGGALALLWNSGDLKVPWVKRVVDLIDTPGVGDTNPVEQSDLVEATESRV
ncbi:MAG: class I SAM-dependent methyltransferase, partial [Nocardioidaceae bacterium]